MTNRRTNTARRQWPRYAESRTGKNNDPRLRQILAQLAEMRVAEFDMDATAAFRLVVRTNVVYIEVVCWRRFFSIFVFTLLLVMNV